jgi:selenocysteine lyase/cysteine desulfurase
MDHARQRLAAWLNVGDDELHLGPSTSQNTYVLANAFRRHLRPGDEVVVTQQDHEANVGAWVRLRDDGIVVRTWEVDAQGALRTEALAALLGPRTRLVAFTHCSNVVGSVHPVREWCDLVHRAGAIAVVDGVSYAPHGLPDVAALGADESLPSQAHFFKADALQGRFTPAGPDHAQVAAVNGVIDYLESVARHHAGAGEPSVTTQAQRVHGLFQQAEARLLQPLLDFLSERPRVRVIGSTQAANRAPTVAFTVQGMKCVEVATALARLDIGVGHGNFYAYRLVQALGLDPDDGVVRASFVHYTSQGEMDRLIAGLRSVID